MSNEDLCPDLEAAIACCNDAGFTVVTRRRSPDERVADEIHQINFAIDRLRDAVRSGGRLNPAVISGLRFKLSEIA